MRVSKPVAITAAAALAAGLAWETHQNWTECTSAALQGRVLDLPSACTDLNSPVTPGPSEVTIGDLEVRSQELKGQALIMTFGEVAMQIGGEESKMDYENPSWIFNRWGETDGTQFWNRNGDSSQEIRWNPCIKVADDYSEPTSSQDGVAKSDRVKPEAETVAVTYNIKQDPITKEVTVVQAGGKLTLDACFVRTPNTVKNAMIVGPNESSANIKLVHQATFGYYMRKLVESFALASACPAKAIDEDRATSLVEAQIYGQIMADNKDNPSVQQLVTDAYNHDRFDFSLEPPEKRQAHYEEQLEKVRAEVSSVKKTFPDPDNNNERYDIETIKLGKMNVKSCDTLNEFRAQVVSN